MDTMDKLAELKLDVTRTKCDTSENSDKKI